MLRTKTLNSRFLISRCFLMHFSSIMIKYLSSLLYSLANDLNTRGPFLETPDNFPGPVSIFSSSFICQLMVIIGANLALYFTKLQRLKFSFQNQRKLYSYLRILCTGNSFRARKVIGSFEKRAPEVPRVFQKWHAPQ